MGDHSRACPVCLGEFEIGDKQRTLPCFHLFHKDCVDDWLQVHDDCPVCRRSIADTMRIIAASTENELQEISTEQ